MPTPHDPEMNRTRLTLSAAQGLTAPALSARDVLDLLAVARDEGTLDDTLDLVAEQVLRIFDGSTLMRWPTAGIDPARWPAAPVDVAEAIGRWLRDHPVALQPLLARARFMTALDGDVLRGLAPDAAWLLGAERDLGDTAVITLLQHVDLAVADPAVVRALARANAQRRGTDRTTLWTDVALHPALGADEVELLLRAGTTASRSNWLPQLLYRPDLTEAQQRRVAQNEPLLWDRDTLDVALIHTFTDRLPASTQRPWALLAHPGITPGDGEALLRGEGRYARFHRSAHNDTQAAASALQTRLDAGRAVPRCWLGPLLTLAGGLHENHVHGRVVQVLIRAGAVAMLEASP